jgi:hypothetical protein
MADQPRRDATAAGFDFGQFGHLATIHADVSGSDPARRSVTAILIL